MSNALEVMLHAYSHKASDVAQRDILSNSDTIGLYVKIIPFQYN
jgi:hypothetical protein